MPSPQERVTEGEERSKARTAPGKTTLAGNPVEDEDEWIERRRKGRVDFTNILHITEVVRLPKPEPSVGLLHL